MHISLWVILYVGAVRLSYQFLVQYYPISKQKHLLISCWLLLALFIVYEYFFAARAAVTINDRGLSKDGKESAFSDSVMLKSYIASNLRISNTLYFRLFKASQNSDGAAWFNKRLKESGHGYIRESDIVSRLPDSSLNHWYIGRLSMILQPGGPGEGWCAIYEVRGRYAWGLAWGWFFIIWGLFALELTLDVSFKAGLLSFLAVGAVYIALQVYSMVGIVLDETGITLRENVMDRSHREGEQPEPARFLAYSDVTSMEKGLFRTTVRGRHGEVLHLPQACYLLPELIDEFVKRQRQDH